MIKSKKELANDKIYTSNNVAVTTNKYMDNPIRIADYRGHQMFFNLKSIKWLFCIIAKILKAKVEVKVWCEKCRGGGIDTDKSNWVNSSIFDCKDCEGKGYVPQEFIELK
jgi:DnaJ-class molecular chaperone